MTEGALAGRVGIVTGGASGIGEAVVRRFVRECAGADDGMSAYNAAKAGVVNLTRTAATEGA